MGYYINIRNKEEVNSMMEEGLLNENNVLLPFTLVPYATIGKISKREVSDYYAEDDPGEYFEYDSALDALRAALS
ncbi:MAG TPA: hypothetical protein VKP65_13420 [Rhodothermales bacterium]|nr:hypothetical protein [Rhodothermales bacterium]